MNILKKPLWWVIMPVVFSMVIPINIRAAEASSAGGPSVNGGAGTGVNFNIRFFDRRIYYVEGDPIYIQVTITNNSPAVYRFKLADERVFSLDFDVKTVSNRTLEPADALIRKRTQSQQVFFREVAIESGESFSFVEDLRGYIKLREPGSLILKARMYPELLRPAVRRTAESSAPADSVILESQRLNFSVRPAVINGPDGIPLEMDTATNALLARERLAPDQVVEYMISARQKSQWERFFLYLDLEEMLARDAARGREWLAESEEGRRRMVERYRRELQNNTIDDGTISVIPTSFTIERTQYSSLEGTVTVLEKFSSIYFTEVKRYTYFLRLKDNVWTIVDYSVMPLGTE